MPPCADDGQHRVLTAAGRATVVGRQTITRGAGDSRRLAAPAARMWWRPRQCPGDAGERAEAGGAHLRFVEQQGHGTARRAGVALGGQQVGGGHASRRLRTGGS
jgi:hypothetical protein